MPVFKNVNKDFFKKWAPEMFYVLGFFAADGYITVNKRGGQFWCIQITDKKLLYRIREVIGSDHKISCRKGKRPKIQDLFRLQVGSIEMCNDLRRLGFKERKTKSLVVPNVPGKYFPDFVRGYFDGDGNVWVGFMHKKRKIKRLAIITMFTSCSLEFLKQLHHKLSLFCLQGGSLYRSKKNYSRLLLSTKDSLKLYNLMYNQGDYKKSGLFLKRKKLVFEKYLRLRNAAVA